MAPSSIHTLERHAFPVLNEQFLVDKTYEYVKELGQGTLSSSTPCPALTRVTGAYGVVCSAKNSVTGESVAIKKVGFLYALARMGADTEQVTKVFQKKILTKRALRELKCVSHLLWRRERC